MVKWIRSGVIEGAPELVAELGGDYRALAREAGLPLRPMTRPDLPIQVERFVRFLDLAATRLGEEAFGLRLGVRQTLGLFGPMAPLLNSAETVADLLRDMAEYFPLHTQGAILGLAREDAGTLMTYELAAGSGSQQRQVVELGFGVLLRELRRHRPGWTPREVYLRHAAPVDRTWHRRLLGDRIAFNADRNAVLVDRATLAQPTVGGDRAIHAPLAERYGVAARAAPEMDGLRVEALVRLTLPFAPIDLATAARILRSSRRSLQRKLEVEGTSFATIFDRVRAGLARSYLLESRLSVAEIAELLGYSETGALTRAVRRWFGENPRRVRRLAN